MAESCGGCKFWRPFTPGNENVYACHFLLDTGIPRCYPPEECIYHTKGLKNMPKALSPETIGQIEQMNAEGKSTAQICEALSVSSATVTRVRNGKLKSPEAPTAMENASEEIKNSGSSADTNILADIVENVKQAGACENNCIPDIVKEVVSHALDNLANEIHILAGNLEELKADRAQLEKWYFENCNEEVKHGTR